MRNRIFQQPIIFVILLAVIARISIFVAFPSVFAFDQTGVIHGSDAYDKYAVNLNTTGIYGLEGGVADAAIPPMYGYSLAGVYSIFGRSSLAVAVFHTVLDSISILLVYAIARRLINRVKIQIAGGDISGEAVGTVAGLFYALYPYLIFQNLTLIDTPFFMVLLHLFVYLMIVLRERAKLDRNTFALAIITGIVLGIATLTRPITAPLAIFIALWFLFRLSFTQTLLRLLPVAIMSVAVLIPWIVRNYDLFDQFVPMTTTSGSNLWQGNSEYTIPVFRAGYDVQWTAPEDIESTIYDPETDSQRFARAIDFWRGNPEVIPELLWTKFLVHWSIDIAPRYNPQEGEQFALDENGNLQIITADESIIGVNEANTAYDEPLFDVIGRWVHRFYYGSLFILALIGFVLTLPYWREMSLLWFVQISMTLIYVIFHPSTRYRVPTDPMLFIFSAIVVVWLVQWWQTRRIRTSERRTQPHYS